MAKLTYRFAQASDLERFYGRVPPHTVRAVVVLEGDTPLVVIGISQYANFLCFFSDVKEEARAHLKRVTVMRALKAAMVMVREARAPVLSDSNNPALMQRLGFQPLNDEGLYQWPIS